MAEFVFPRCAAHEKEIEKIDGINRLYAYPSEPRYKNNAYLTILDSGAFGLSRSGGKMTETYKKSLSEHYYKFARGNTLCVAPDKRFDPIQSMLNFKKWLRMGYFEKITPVLQTEKKGLNFDDLKYQAEFYREYSDTICFANALNYFGKDAQELKLEKLFFYLKSELGYVWIHVLGAGFSIFDIKQWNEVGYFDSLDSIAYYQSKDAAAFGSLDPVENVEAILECLRI